MNKFAVIDTETTWSDAVMSIGVVVADAKTYEPADKRYYILTPYKNHGGLYSNALYLEGVRPDGEYPREKAMEELIRFLDGHDIRTMFAYNAAFDYQHLPELSHLSWYDIMKIAAYRQYNPKIPECADCYGTGRLKRGYGVESIYRMLSENAAYCEMHNALADAMDELEIMRLLQHEMGTYRKAKIRQGDARSGEA